MDSSPPCDALARQPVERLPERRLAKGSIRLPDAVLLWLWVRENDSWTGLRIVKPLGGEGIVGGNQPGETLLQLSFCKSVVALSVLTGRRNMTKLPDEDMSLLREMCDDSVPGHKVALLVTGGSLSDSLDCLPVPCRMSDLARCTGLIPNWEGAAAAEQHRVQLGHIRFPGPERRTSTRSFSSFDGVVTVAGPAAAGAVAAAAGPAPTLREPQPQPGREHGPLVAKVQTILNLMGNGDTEDAAEKLVQLLKLFEMKQCKDNSLSAVKAGSKYGADHCLDAVLLADRVRSLDDMEEVVREFLGGGSGGGWVVTYCSEGPGTLWECWGFSFKFEVLGGPFAVAVCKPGERSD